MNVIRGRDVVKWILKAILGGGIALIAASLFCLLYFFSSSDRIPSDTGATDYAYQSNSVVNRMTEGIAWKKADENGYFSNAVSADDIDILLMGSSHIEALQLPDRQTTTWLLNDMLDLSVYNIGISGHTLLVNAKNLDEALDAFAPSQYVVFESARTSFSDDEIAELLDQTMGSLLQNGGSLRQVLRNIPYLRLFWYQCNQLLGQNDEDVVDDEMSSSASYSQESYDALMAYISEICQAHDVQPIIFYHPSLLLAWDGSVSSNADEESLLLFQTACEENGIVFVNMTQDFIDMYYDDHVLPTGFCNTAVGTGHMNQYGHRAVAERLAAVITDLEESGEVVAS